MIRSSALIITVDQDSWNHVRSNGLLSYAALTPNRRKFANDAANPKAAIIAMTDIYLKESS